MAEGTWSKVEGMVIAGALDPMKLAEELKSQGVVALLEWYDATPELVGVNLVVEEGYVGTLSKRGKTVRPGPSLEEVAESVAEKFSAEVRLGDIQVDRFVESDAVEEARKAEEEEAEKHSALPIRVAEVSATPSSAIPLLAAFEGVDVAELGHDQDRQILLAQVPGSKSGWTFGDAPVIRLTMQGDEFHAHFMPDDDPESVITYNWGMNELLVAGAKGWDKEAPENIYELVGPAGDIRAIYEAVPGVSLEEALEAAKMRGSGAVTRFVRALGLDPQIGEFLLGWLSLEQITGAKVHHARGISNAIGRSVDILLDERRAEKSSSFWDAYTHIVQTKPWLIPLLAAGEAAVAAALLVVAQRPENKGTIRATLSKFVGVALIVDAIADTTLARLTANRVARKEQGLSKG